MFALYVTEGVTQHVATFPTLLGAMYFALRLNAPGRKPRVWNCKTKEFVA